jgi:hypothetical protein
MNVAAERTLVGDDGVDHWLMAFQEAVRSVLSWELRALGAGSV